MSIHVHPSLAIGSEDEVSTQKRRDTTGSALTSQIMRSDSGSGSQLRTMSCLRTTFNIQTDRSTVVNPSLITSDSRSGASHGRGIVFVTNSKPYLDALIPQKYQILCDTATNDFTIALQDKSLIAFGKAPQPQAIIVDIDDLQNISRHWLVIIPTLGGTPELVTRVNRAPVLWLPALEQIIKNIGHMSFYSLYEPLFDQIEDEQDDEQIDGGKYDDERPPEIVSRLGNAYLRPPTCVVRVIAYLEGEKTDNGGGLVQYTIQPA
ncbi:hypothetical protein ACEPPN_006496 [Leptodophora sp. 'Broadleaf-Isolate-01']